MKICIVNSMFFRKHKQAVFVALSFLMGGILLAAPDDYALFYVPDTSLSLTGSFGYDNYDYKNTDVNDSDRFVEKLELNKSYLRDALTFDLAYKRVDLVEDQAGRKKGKNEVAGSARAKLQKPLLHAIKINAAYGNRDAKDDEDLDKDIDYTYAQKGITLDHIYTRDTRFYNACQHYIKDYKAIGLYDNEGFEFKQGWKITPLKINADTFSVNLILAYKKFNYFDRNDLDFEKSGLALKGTINQQKNWKLTTGLGYNHRNQRDNTKDRNDYTINAGYEKDLLENLLELGLLTEYINRDYENAGDKNLYRIKATINYKI